MKKRKSLTALVLLTILGIIYSIIHDKNARNIFNSLILIVIILFIIIFITKIIKFFIKRKKEKQEDDEFAQQYITWEKNKYGNDKINKKELCRRIQEFENEQNSNIYHKKDLLTNSEKEFLIKLQDIYNTEYIIQPQIPLGSIVNKDRNLHNKYASELNRYIDFGIFDKNYNLLMLIELQDNTHLQEERKYRDDKVKNICKQANIPLIEIWNKNINNEELREIINKGIYEN